MVQVTQESIFNRFPLAKPVGMEFDDLDERFFCDVMPWSFNQTHLKLIHTILAIGELCSMFGNQIYTRR